MGAGAGTLPHGEYGRGDVLGVLGIGGSGGTVLITPRPCARLPVGLPKLMVSTVASGNTAPYVGLSDITIMSSVVDVAGFNAVSRRVLGNAAGAMAGMVQHQVLPVGDKPTLGMTMFGVTTPCVTAVREWLEATGYDCLVFHATGTGGQAMEKLVETGLIKGVLDITTTEVADEVVGGILPCGPHRFEAILAARVPYVLSRRRPRHGQLWRGRNGPGDVPQSPPSRPQCTGDLDADHAGRKSPLRPLHCRQAESGVRAVSDSAARERDSRRSTLRGSRSMTPRPTSHFLTSSKPSCSTHLVRSIRRLPVHINDPAFARALVDAFLSLAGAKY